MSLQKAKVLIINNSGNFGLQLADKLADMEIYPVIRSNKSDTLASELRANNFNIVVFDYSDVSVRSIITEIEQNQEKSPFFIILSDEEKINLIDDERVMLVSRENALIQTVFVIKLLMKRLNKQHTVEMAVTEILRSIGISAHLIGYRYLRTAVLCAVKNISLLDSVTTMLYPCVADLCETTESRVERSIRHAIENACEKDNADSICRFLGYRVSRPKSSEVIASIVDKIRMEFQI